MEHFLIAIIIFASALLQGLSGFGSALVAMSMLPMFVDLRFVVAFVALNSMLINLLNFYKVKDQFRFKELLPIIIGSAAGVPIGIYCLENIDPTIIKRIMGSFLIAYSLYSLLHKTYHIKKAKKLLGGVSGFLAGIMGGAFNLNGPFIVIYCSMCYKDKHMIKALMSSYFIVAGFYICTLFAIKGIINISVLKSFACFSPVLIAGIFIGNHFYNKINHESFKKIVYLILTLSGLLLILK